MSTGIRIPHSAFRNWGGAAAVIALGALALSNAPSQRARDEVRRVMPGIGAIYVRDRADQSPWQRGSAVIVREDGVVVTSFHVIRSERTDRLFPEIFFELAAGRRRLPLRPLLISKADDLALLRLAGDAGGAPYPKLEIGDARALRELDDIFVIGFPEKGGATVTVNAGLVEGLDLAGNWIKTGARLIQGNSGGAAVNEAGQLVGIPTKVVSDEVRVDADGDGFPDEVRRLGQIGYLRPAYLVKALLEQLDRVERQVVSKDALLAQNPPPPSRMRPMIIEQTPAVKVHGAVREAGGGPPIAGALIGLVPPGSAEVTVKNLLSWGRSNSEGVFELNNKVPPGPYLLVARSLRHQALKKEIEVKATDGGHRMTLEMQAARPRSD